MGAAYEARKDLEKTMECWIKGLDMATKSFGENSHQSFLFSKLLASFLCKQEQFQKALPYAKKSLEIALNVFSNDSEEVASSYKILGDIYINQQDPTKALIPYKKAADFYEKAPSPNCLYEIYFQLVGISCFQGDFQQASNFLAKANQALMATSGLSKERVAETYRDWAQMMESFSNMIEESKIYYLKAADLFKSFKPLNKALIEGIYSKVGRMAWKQKDWNKALECFQECEKHIEKTDLNSVRAVNMFQGLIFLNLNKIDEAEKHFQIVSQGHKAGDRDEFDTVRVANQNLGAIYEGRGKLKEALDFYKKAVFFLEQRENKHDLGIQKMVEKISEIEKRLKG